MVSALTEAPVVLADSPGEELTITVPAEVLRWLEGGMVTANVGFELGFEGRQLAAAIRDGRQLLSIRWGADEVLIGPRWVPDGNTACAGCAEARLRLAVDHPLLTRGDVNASPRGGWPAALAVLVEVGLDHLGGHPLDPGEMLSVGLAQSRRHRVARSNTCLLCGPRQSSVPLSRGRQPGRAPEALALRSHLGVDAVPVRGRNSQAVGETLAPLVDHRIGPVLQLTRDNRAPLAMSGALVPASRAVGYGRSGDFARAGTVAILEAYERIGAFPHEGQVIQDLSYDEIGEMAIDPATLGRYSRAQLDHPNARVMEYRPDGSMDWAYAHQLDTGAARLVPADVAFYGYDYHHRLDYHAGRRASAAPRRVHFFAESSSGCAIGSSLEEAAVHGLLELIERDAFLMAWCRRVPLATIGQDSLDDPTCALLIDAIEARGFDVHLLVTTYDLGLPSLWALAVNRLPDAVPATFSAAASSPVPIDAVRGALWELVPLVGTPPDGNTDHVGRLVDDPSLVDTIEDHVNLFTRPEMRHRVTEVLGGPTSTLAAAFPGWPDRLCHAAQGDVRGALDFLVAQCRQAGLDQALVVDQSTREHRDIGLRVARVIVPGILPMCFGSPQQRLSGIPRRARALEALGRGDNDDRDLLLDPHPFP